MASNPMFAKLLLKSGTDKLRGEIPPTIVLNKHKITIGRHSASAPNDVVLSVVAGKNDIISRRHAEITFTLDGQFVIRDLGALNGIFVNDRKIEMHVLQDKDVVQFGGICNAPLGTVLKGSNLCVQYVFCREADARNANPQRSARKAQTQTQATIRDFAKTPRAADTAVEIGTGKIPTSEATGEAPRRQERNPSTLNAPTQLPFKPDSPEAVQPAAGQALAADLAAHLASISSSLSCAICSSLLLDAVVCSCSHGFCRACIETYHRSRGFRRPTCPVCSVRPAPALRPPRKSHSAALARAPDSDDEYQDEPLAVAAPGGGAPAAVAALAVAPSEAVTRDQVACYFRSSHLDSVVSIVVEAGGPEAIAAFQEREKSDRDVLKRYHIDPDAPIDFNYKCFRRRDRPRAEKHNGSAAHPPAVLCSYCGEEGHLDSKCPHDDGRSRKRKRGYLSPPLRSPHFSDSDSTGECSTPSDQSDASDAD